MGRAGRAGARDLVLLRCVSRTELERALALHGRTPVGIYTIQAAIAAPHAEEPRGWP